jgi:hypothetical protein
MQRRQLPDFDSIVMYDNVSVILTQDSMCGVTVEAGKNIIGGITTEITDGVLILRNHNKCNWTRSYETPIIAHLSVKNLRGLYYNSSGNVSSTNALTSPRLNVSFWGGCGTIELTLNIWEGVFVQQMGTADIRLHGVCAICSIYAGDYGLFQCSDLESGYSFTKNFGTNDCYVKATHFLEATIGSIGNIYYAGNPDSLQTHIHGSGAVLPIVK